MICFMATAILKRGRKLRTMKILFYAMCQALVACIVMLICRQVDTPERFRYRATGASFSPEWWFRYCKEMKRDGVAVDPALSRH